MNEADSKLILPSTGLNSEHRVKGLAIKFMDVATGYDNREILAALAVAAGCAIRARYTFNERDSAFVTTVNIMKHCKDQL